MFADDVKIAFPISCLVNCNQLQSDITKLLEWSNLWELHFNEKKCRVMHFHFRKVFEYNYYLNNHVLTVDTTHQDLGIVLSVNLMWVPHFKLILSRAYKVLGLLCRVFSTFNVLNPSAFFISPLLDLTYFTVLLCGVLTFYPTFGPLKLCKEELPNSLFVTAHLTIRNV